MANEESKKSYRYDLIIFGTALILRAVYLALTAANYRSGAFFLMMQDSRTYISVAKYILGTMAVGESELVLAGPGYGAFLAGFIAIFGQNPWPILIVQIILSCLSAVLVYRIALILFERKLLAVSAGLIAAISATSVSLSSAILSDCLFFFLMTLSFWLYLKGLKNPRWSLFAWSGIALGFGILVRSVGMFLPVVFVAMYYLFIPEISDRRKALTKAIAAVLIPIVIAGGWSIRNYVKHDIFAVSDSGTLAMKDYLAARILFEADSSKRLMEYRNEMTGGKIDVMTPGERHENAVEVAGRVIGEHPGLFLKVYLKDIYENITMQNTLAAVQLKQYRDFYDWWTNNLTWNGKQPLIFILTVTGFVILLISGFYRPTIFLILLYLYFALISGVTYWQGSRIFHPALLSWAIAIGAIIQLIWQKITYIEPVEESD